MAEEDVQLPPGFPEPYIGFCKGDKRKALELYNRGQAIRQELQLDSILDNPYPYAKINELYPIALQGKSKAGEYILVQSPGKLDVAKMKASGLGRDDAVKHLAYHIEFIIKHLDNDPKILMVIDMAGLGLLSHLASGEFLGAMGKINETIGAVYTRRVSRYAVTHPPALVEMVWKLLEPILPAGARENCAICPDAAALEPFMEAGIIPTEFGGSRALGDCDEMRKLLAHANAHQ